MPDTVAAPFHALANETWSIVLGSLPLHDLASSSHVSRTWQALAFPHLYHTVYLTAARHLEDISTRVSLDQGGPLSLRDAVRGLVIDQKETVTGELVTEADVGRLVKLLPELLRLEHFSWETTFVPRNLQLADVLQSKCPNLKSVGWMINNDSELTLHNRRNTYIKMLKFKNLSHFRLMVREIPPEFDDDYGSPLSDLLQACPNLVSIELELNGDEEFLHWSPDRLVAPLGSSSLPSLRVFRALGAAVPGWSEFFDSPDDSPLRTFFSRHPKLHTLGLGWVTGESYDDEIDPSTMEDLFPSLRHLEAPAFFCAPVIASSLGPRLESLAVTDEYYDSSSSPSTIANAIQPLPVLRKLELRATNENSIEAEALKALLGAAPNLKELYFPVPLDEPSEFLDVLRAAPGLRLLRIATEEALTGVQEELGVSSWKECIPALAEICPHLRRIDNVGGFDAKSYKVERNPDGNVGLTEPNSGSWPRI